MVVVPDPAVVVVPEPPQAAITSINAPNRAIKRTTGALDDALFLDRIEAIFPPPVKSAVSGMDTERRYCRQQYTGRHKWVRPRGLGFWPGGCEEIYSGLLNSARQAAMPAEAITSSAPIFPPAMPMAPTISPSVSIKTPPPEK